MVYVDETLLSGESVSRMLNVLARHYRADCVLLRDLDGAGDALPSLREVEAQRMPVGLGHVLYILSELQQIVWADFYLHGCSAPVRPSYAESRVQALLKSSVLLRCVDNTYMYVYGEGGLPAIEPPTTLRHVETRECDIELLEFPE